MLFGFGVTALANTFGAPGEASQLLPANSRAPELRTSLQPPTPSSDLFALAVLLRNLLPPQIPAEISAHLARASTENPHSRPQDIATFTSRLSLLSQNANPSVLPLPSVDVPVPVPALPLPSVDVPVPVPVPVPALPLSLQPLPPGAPSMPRASLLALLLVLSGLVLMLGGVATAFVYATHHAPAAPPKTASVPPHFVPPPVAVAPTPEPPVAPPPPPAEPEMTLNPPRIRHAPMVAPGAGPSSFPDDARAALPRAWH